MFATHQMKVNGIWYGAGEEIRADNQSDTKTVPYTRTMIYQMNTEELKRIALKEGIPEPETKTGSALKRELIEHFGL